MPRAILTLETVARADFCFPVSLLIACKSGKELTWTISGSAARVPGREIIKPPESITVKDTAGDKVAPALAAAFRCNRSNTQHTSAIIPAHHPQQDDGLSQRSPVLRHLTPSYFCKFDNSIPPPNSLAAVVDCVSLPLAPIL